MTWLTLSIITGLIFALSRFVARLFLRTQGNALAFTAIHNSIAGLVLLPLLIFYFHLPNQFIVWLFFIGLVIFAFLSDWFAFQSLKLIDLSEYQIINQTRHIFVLLGGLVVFSELITITKVLAISLITLGVIVMLYQKRRFYWLKGVGLTILSTICAVIAFIFVKLVANNFSAPAMASMELILIGIISFGMLGFKKQKIIDEWKINKTGLIIAGALFGLFELFLFMSLRIGEISKVIPVTQSSLVFGVLLGIFFLKEHNRWPQKIIGTILIVVGIALLNFF